MITPEVDPSLTNNYYVLHDGTEFKVLYMDASSADAWVKYGWETRCFDTNEEAQHGMAAWKVGKPHIRLTLMESLGSEVALPSHESIH